jgi:hypothetical protein
MSGIFWEPDAQPNLREAVSGYTLSTINLALAIPMAGIDFICTLLLSMKSLLFFLIEPVVECIMSGFEALFVMLGLESVSHTTMFILLLGVYNCIVTFSSGYKTNNFYQQCFSRVMFFLTGVFWILSFLNFPILENALFPQVALLAVGLQVGILTIDFLLLEYNDFSSKVRENTMNGLIKGVLVCIRMEVFAALTVATFGYPKLTKEDGIHQYFCLAPILAMQMIYFSSVKQKLISEDIDKQPYTNGATIVVQENPKEETILEAESKGIADEVSEDAIENNEQETKENGSLLENGVASKIADVVNIASTVAVEATEKTDTVGNEIAGENPNTSEEVVKPSIGSLKRFAECISENAVKIISPIIKTVSKASIMIKSLPWYSTFFNSLIWSSHMIYSYAWFHLTGNMIAYMLPIFTLIIPCLPKIPIHMKHLMYEAANAGAAAVQFQLITSIDTDD